MSLTTDEMATITLEIQRGEEPSITTREALSFRKAMIVELKKMDEDGITVVMPYDWDLPASTPSKRSESVPNSDLPPEEHEKILDNDDAMRFASDAAIARAMARGMTRSEAEHIYGFDPEPVLTTEEMNGILLEIMRGEKPDKPELPRRAKFRRELAEEVAEMKKAGIVPETVRE